MKLEITLQFNHDDATSAEIALTPEQLAMPRDEFIALASNALGVIHHNMQSYLWMTKNGSLDPLKAQTTPFSTLCQLAGMGQATSVGKD